MRLESDDCGANGGRVGSERFAVLTRWLTGPQRSTPSRRSPFHVEPSPAAVTRAAPPGFWCVARNRMRMFTWAMALDPREEPDSHHSFGGAVFTATLAVATMPNRRVVARVLPFGAVRQRRST